MKTSLCNMTNYPKIFKDCPWGRIQYDCDASNNIIKEEQINNRNEFVEEFSIVRQKVLPEKHLKKLQKQGWRHAEGHIDGEMCCLLDHIECYYTGVKTKKHVLIYSPYRARGDTSVVETFNKYGFNEYKPLYADNATTFVRVFDAN